MAFNVNAQDAVVASEDILAAADALDATLQSMNLPLAFPTPASIQQAIKELSKANGLNHELLAEYLKLQVIVADDRESAVAAAVATASQEPKAVSAAAQGVHQLRQLHEDHETAATPSRTVSVNFSDHPTAAISADSATKLARRASTRLSVSLDIASASAVSDAAAAVTTPGGTHHPVGIHHPVPQPHMMALHSAQSSIKKVGAPLLLNPDEQSWCSTIAFYCRENPELLVAFASRLDKSEYPPLAALVVHRLCAPWSADEAHLGAVVHAFARQRQHSGVAATEAVMPAGSASTKFSSARQRRCIKRCVPAAV